METAVLFYFQNLQKSSLYQNKAQKYKKLVEYCHSTSKNNVLFRENIKYCFYYITFFIKYVY